MFICLLVECHQQLFMIRTNTAVFCWQLVLVKPLQVTDYVTVSFQTKHERISVQTAYALSPHHQDSTSWLMRIVLIKANNVF